MFCTFWLVNVLSATAACHFSTIFRHLHVKKWPESVSFLRFWLENVPLATAACNFSTSQLQKVARDRQFFTILTCKCASRYSGVQFFDIATSKSGPRMLCFVHFRLANVPLATAACNFSTSQLQKVVRPRQFFSILTWKCASRYSGVQFFLCPLQSYLRISEVTFRPSRHTKHWKTQHFATSLTFRACGSSFFPHLLIFFLAALLFQLPILSEVRLLNFLRLGDGHQPNSRGLYTHYKDSRIPIKGGMTIPNIATFDHGTCCFFLSFRRGAFFQVGELVEY